MTDYGLDDTNRKGKERLIYSNIFSDNKDEAIRNILSNPMSKELGWTKSEHIPTSILCDEVRNVVENNFKKAMETFKEMFNCGTFVMKGRVKNWSGTKEKCCILHTFSDMQRLCMGDAVKIVDINGLMVVYKKNNDDISTFELKHITERGWKFYNENYMEMNRQTIVDTLWNKKGYSVLIHYANRYLGCPKYQY